MGELKPVLIEVGLVLVEVELDRVVNDQVLDQRIAIPHQHVTPLRISEPCWPSTSACSP